MKIRELSQKTGVSKESIHYYIREGVLRRPRKSGKNTADYNNSYVEQINIIKNLRENYYLPIPVIKKIMSRMKKESPSEQVISQLQSKYFRPLERLMLQEIAGREKFSKETGLGKKWLLMMEKWRVITPKIEDGTPIYSKDDVAIGKLIVDMDKLGFGPKDGHDPEDLRHVSDFVREWVATIHEKYYQSNLERLVSENNIKQSTQFREIFSLFFYHLYCKQVRIAFDRLIGARKGKESMAETSG
jgi:DNA-binding transcriptional MerR regulator